MLFVQMETDDAIERMAEYRATSKEKQLSSNIVKDTSATVKQFRKIAIKFYWVNAVFYATTTFAILIAGKQAMNMGAYIFVPLTALMTRQTFKTIERLEATDGRGTIFDDAFLSVLSMVVFFLLYPFNPFSTDVFTTIHIIFSITWAVQLYFVFFKKPPAQFATDTMLDEMDKNLFSKPRLIALSIGLVIGILLALPFLI